MNIETQEVVEDIYEEGEETIENVVPPTDIFSFF